MEKIVTAPPKSVQVADFLREEIRSLQLKPGDRLQPARTLADRFEVSKQVVQRSFAILEGEGLVETQVGRGTFVRKPPHSIAARTVVMLLNGTNDSHSRLPVKLTSAAQRRGWMPYLFDVHHSHEPATVANVRALLAERPRAVIAAPYCRFNLDLLDYVQPGTQLVLVTHFEGDRDYEASYIMEDFVEAGRRAGRYLLSRGRRRITVVTYDREPGWTSDDMLTGFEEVLAAEGLAVEHYFYEQADAVEIARELAGHDAPDGIFVVSDHLFRRIAPFMASRGLAVGRDFDAIGVGNTPWAETFGIATIDHHEDELATAAAEAVENGWQRRVNIVPSVVLPPPGR